ncbi:hypothetical protein E2C01_051129 [Portunus trituberculatus]|uniref:Uncharacterized protein n=1 Tax=Portunus trituberculatus TaxID=210409 RepID=A0A5B7GIB9_PORTR|nr:hypothetical protein [Portunus trituberculatus]
MTKGNCNPTSTALSQWHLSFNVDKCDVLHTENNNDRVNHSVNSSDLLNVNEKKDFRVPSTPPRRPHAPPTPWPPPFHTPPSRDLGRCDPRLGTLTLPPLHDHPRRK